MLSRVADVLMPPFESKQPNDPEIFTEPWIYWLQAARRHAARATEWREIATSGLPIGQRLVEATLEELPSAMEAIATAAFAVDGFESAVGDLVNLPAKRGSRAKVIVKNLSEVCGLPDQAKYETDVQWLFRVRNEAVHGGVWKTPFWHHPNGMSVAAVQRDINALSARRAVQVCCGLLKASLGGPHDNPALEEWGRIRRSRCEDLLSVD